MDAIAREAGLEPHEVRLRNLIPSGAMPFDNITNKHFDSGDYPECLRRVVAAIDVPAFRARQAAAPGPVRLGLGMAIFCEQAAHGTSVYAGWGIPMVPGFEQAAARLSPDGGLEIRVGIQSHGQGLETTLAQVAHSVLGVPVTRVRVVHGDTAMTPYSTGTWGSRCIVMAGGAVAAACTELAGRIAAIGAHLLQVDPRDVTVTGGEVRGQAGSVGIAEVARTFYRRPQDLPDDANGAGLEVTAGYKAGRDSGTFSYAAHACILQVDTQTGDVKILDYAICEDGGVLVNPMIVDGQVTGGVAQGIGTALYEEMPFDDAAQPMAATLADYMLPGATEVPVLRIDHMETPSPYTRFGQKGIGEGGAIGPPAAIANAVNDALAGLGARVDRLPVTPHRIMAAIMAAGGMKPAAFVWAAPSGIAEAAALLAAPDSRAMGGGQSLGPMLNFRAARPAAVVPVTGLAALQGVEDAPDAITLGAATTHAAIADGRTPDFAGAILARIAAGIAYRAVRNRGTIGGSLCHADPAADWLTTLMALGAVMLTTRRAVALDQFITGPYRTVLEPGEILRAVRIPRPPAGSFWGYHKLCRKPGEFAHAMAAALVTPGGRRLVLGATGGPPILLLDGQANPEGAAAALAFQDGVTRRIQLAAITRALAEAGA